MSPESATTEEQLPSVVEAPLVDRQCDRTLSLDGKRHRTLDLIGVSFDVLRDVEAILEVFLTASFSDGDCLHGDLTFPAIKTNYKNSILHDINIL